MKRKTVAVKRDAIDYNRRKRHSVAVKRGIKRAKKVRKESIRASSVHRGKSKSEIAAALFKTQPAPGQ